MSGTRRQQIQAALRSGTYTLRDVSEQFGLRLKDAEQEVQHAGRSARPARLRVTEPARCLGCGYVFKSRARLTAPSRCPRCRSEDTTPPRFEIR